MDKIKWVPIIDDIYKQNFHLCYGGDSEEFIRFLEYNKDIEITDDDKDVLMGSKGCVYANGTYFYLWCSKQKKPMPVIIHELYHYVMRHLQSCCIEYSDETEEAFAYYIEYLYEKIVQELPKLMGKKNG